MSLKQKIIALLTIIRKELSRLCRIWIMAFLSPIISIFLYFLIFGNIMGQKIGFINHIPYNKFIAPGLILSSIMFTSYGQVSSSFFLRRFQRNVEEMLVTPMSHTIILSGFIISGVIRAFFVSMILFTIIVRIFHVDIFLNLNLIIDIIMISTLFSLIGFTNALLARDFDEISLVPFFIIIPLSYLGGVFYNFDMLPKAWQTIALYNPMYYIIQTFRAHSFNLVTTAKKTELMLLVLIISFYIINLRLMKKSILLKK